MFHGMGRRSGGLLVSRRVISLVSCCYKIVAKFLANRLKQCSKSIIDTNQAAFIKDRQILDGILFANELVDNRRKAGIPGLLLKVDFEKVYDHVNWHLYSMGIQGNGLLPEMDKLDEEMHTLSIIHFQF